MLDEFCIYSFNIYIKQFETHILGVTTYAITTNILNTWCIETLLIDN